MFQKSSYKNRPIIYYLGAYKNPLSYYLNILIHLSLFVEVLKPRSLLKLSPQTRGPKNYSKPQSHTFISLLTKSQVLSPNQSGSQVPTLRLQITYSGAYD
jgi:hypothetical protein